MKRLSLIMTLALAIVMCACAGDKKENNKNMSTKTLVAYFSLPAPLKLLPRNSPRWWGARFTRFNPSSLTPMLTSTGTTSRAAAQWR